MKVKKVICPKCKGLGEVDESAFDRGFFLIFTLGLGAMWPREKVTCPQCGGCGYVEIPDLRE